MARPTHRLDIHLVPTIRDSNAVSMARQLVEDWTGRGWIDAEGRPTASAGLPPCRRVRIDDPGGLVLYANSLGGFRVRCPSCDTSLARVFRPLDLTVCPGCGADVPVEQAVCEPPVAVGRASVVLIDVEHTDLPVPEGFVTVLRRV